MSDNTENPGQSTEQSSAPTAAAAAVSGVKTINLEDELKQSFIDYAMSVIVDRALPDVRDGLKPVHRRVLYDMYDLKVWHNGQTKKSARIVGDVIGRFHPHGDVAVYDTIVRMAQWFSMREPLIFGQGNFGDIDGDGAAAMRYTEVRMTKIAERMLQDIDKDTVNTYPNYDGNEQIPEVLPTRFPNLLVNGSSGIAVGMATNIPTHNLGEVINGTLQLLDNPELSLEELMRYIPGPDFPTGGIIVGREGIKQAYATGRGRCIIRSRTHIETDHSGRQSIIVDEIPYVVHKVDIVKQIAQMLRDKKLEGIAEINDLSDKKNPVRIAIDLKRDAYPEAVLNNLYQSTMLQSSFPINMVALVHNHPRQLGLMEILREFLKFRREVVTRRTVFLLRQDRRKAHVDEGLLLCKANIQRVIDLITSSQNQEEARVRLMAEPWDNREIMPLIERTAEGVNLALPQGIPEDRGLHGDHYFLSDAQAKAILALPLSRLTHLAQDEIKNDYLGLLQNIRGYLEILNDPERMKAVIRQELEDVRSEYANKRRTDFTEDYGRFDKADLIARQDVIVTLSSQGYIKYQDIATYESQHRGGKGRLAAKLKDEDFITSVVVANTHDHLMCFTSRGRAFVTMVYDLPTSDNRTWKGRPIQNLFEIEEGERITALLPLSEIEENTYFFMATAAGTVKKSRVSDFRSFIDRSNSKPLTVMNLQEGDELIGADISQGDDDIYLFTSQGKALRFCEYYSPKGAEGAEDTDGVEDNAPVEDGAESQAPLSRHSGMGVRPAGRTSGGVRGIRLPKGGRVVSLMVRAQGDPHTQCMLVCAFGLGKRVDLAEFPMHNRGSQGNTVLKINERSGEVVAAVPCDPQGDFMLISDQGQLIRSPISDTPLLGVYSTGSILMRIEEGERIISAVSIDADVVESSRRTAQARAAERAAQKAEREQEAAYAAAPDEAASEGDRDDNLGNSDEDATASAGEGESGEEL
ncbi:MAG: DNA gyrase subunit A [Succinivibrio sp.]|nr:DNA gyrase subunit A [Succinivibrio sp.]